MTQGDVVSDLESIGSGSYLEIKPSAGDEWVIHNVYHDNDAHLEQYDGSNSLVFDSSTGEGAWADYFFHVTENVRMRVKNTSGSAQLIGYDGVKTKE